MKSISLDTTITACELEKVLSAGTNITITKIDDCNLQISSTGAGATGIQYHLKDGDSVTVPECFVYCVCTDLILDANSTLTADAGAIISVDGGLTLNGCLILDGYLKFNC